MAQYFSFKRLADMTALSLTENRKKVLMQVLVMAAIIIGFILFMTLMNIGTYGSQPYYHVTPDKFEFDPLWNSVLIPMYVMSIFGFSALSASLSMEWMSTPNRRLNTLMIPATQLEKYIARWIIYVFGFFIVFNIVFLFADYLRVITTPVIARINDIECVSKPKTLLSWVDYAFSHEPIFKDRGVIWMLISMLLAFQSLFVLGSSIWPRNSFIKSAAISTVLILVFIFTGVYIAENVFDYSRYNYPRADYFGEHFGIMAAIFMGITLFNWTLAYFRFKESEIIQRW